MRRLVKLHVNPAVINTSIPLNENIFAQFENNVKRRGKVIGNFIVVVRMMLNLIACSTKEPWTPIREKYVARYISSQILPMENSFEYNSYRKQLADAQIQIENPFLFYSQRKQFVDA